MRRLLSAIVIAVTAVIATATDWTLVWQDDFDGPEIDSSIWKRIPRGGSDWENYMSAADSLYAVRDGHLVLRGVVNRTEKNDTAPYLTGGLWTYGGMSFVPPCRVEIRTRLHGATGCWPAIWMLPYDTKRYPYPTGGEIDIMEHINYDKEAWQTVHSTYTLKYGQTHNPPHYANTPVDYEAFNDYAVEIMPDSLSFFINGKKTLTYPRISTDIPGQYPFMIPMALLVDMQLGGGWVGKIDPRDLPVEFEVDRVSYYRPATGPYFRPETQNIQKLKNTRKK